MKFSDSIYGANCERHKTKDPDFRDALVESNVRQNADISYFETILVDMRKRYMYTNHYCHFDAYIWKETMKALGCACTLCTCNILF